MVFVKCKSKNLLWQVEHILICFWRKRFPIFFSYTRINHHQHVQFLKVKKEGSGKSWCANQKFTAVENVYPSGRNYSKNTRLRKFVCEFFKFELPGIRLFIPICQRLRIPWLVYRNWQCMLNNPNLYFWWQRFQDSTLFFRNISAFEYTNVLPNLT